MRPVEKPDYELRKRYAREACQTIDAMPSPPMDAIAVSPAMAELWQELQFDEFQRAVHIKRLRGIDRVAWTKTCTRTVKDVKDYSKELVALEAKIVKSQSAFGKHLGALQDLRELDYIPSVWDLPQYDAQWHTHWQQPVPDGDHGDGRALEQSCLHATVASSSEDSRTTTRV